MFHWVQTDGHESLDPTTDVAASPPIVTLAPGDDYTVRVVRTAKTVVQGEESYRVWVDQLPASQRQSQSGINILIRQSIPVFFRARQLTRPNVSWTLRLEGGRLVIVASNSGDERLRIASLRLRDAAGATASFGNGLVGYVLGRSSVNFTIPNPPRGFGASGAVSIAAESNDGPIHATAQLQNYAVRALLVIGLAAVLNALHGARPAHAAEQQSSLALDVVINGDSDSTSSELSCGFPAV